MLMTKWNMDDALAVAREEGHEDGWDEGLEEGIEKGRWEGEENKALEIARNALTEGSTLEFVRKITGLDMDTIEGLRAGL